jgi:PA domain
VHEPVGVRGAGEPRQLPGHARSTLNPFVAVRRSSVRSVWASVLLAALVPAHDVAAHTTAQPGAPERQLPPARHNVELVGKLRLAPVVPHRIGDVGVHGDYAYLAAYSEPSCRRGGVYIVHIANPRRPRRVGFIRAAEDSFVGEGVQVKTIRTRNFKGELLVHNNEICGEDKRAQGGISLYDVSRPPRPRRLASGVGDRRLVDGTVWPRAHQVHSAFLWQAGPRAHLVMVDDEEPADVDIMDVTNPRRPRLVSETDLAKKAGQPNVNGQTPFLHDMIVKRIGGTWTMLASYWDGGYVQLDVDNPARPRLIRHTNFKPRDPQRAARGHTISAEGNAHQAEFDRTNRYFLATDEDFASYRLFTQITTGPHAGRYVNALQGTAASALDTGRVKDKPDDPSRIGPKRRLLAGRTAFVGLACHRGSVPPPASLEVRIAVVERGICLFSDKARTVAAAGYEGMVIFNRAGPDGGCDTLDGISIDTQIPALFISRSDGMRLLGAYDPGTYQCTETAEGVATDTQPPPIGSLGEGIGARATFDGWGYMHLYERRTLREVDTYAIPESQSTRFATGYGDLSVHEVATDPDTNLAYVAYYGGGLRVISFGRSGIREVGRYISPAGNNLWGVEVLKHRDGSKYIVTSDRDTGLWIFRYTGPPPRPGG